MDIRVKKHHFCLGEGVNLKTLVFWILNVAIIHELDSTKFIHM